MNALHRAARRAIRALLGFAYPDYASQQEQLQAVTRSLQLLDERLQKAAREQAKQIAAVSEVLGGQPTRQEFEVVAHDVRRLRSQVDRQGRVTLKAVRRGDARTEATREERRVLQRLERIATTSRPIVVGPWSGEVGFELLYWVPFVHWFRQKYDIDPRRLVVLSRGGVNNWYSHVSARYVEAFSYVSTDAFREATEIVKKQRALTPFDVKLLRRVVRAEGLGRVHLLHPEAMYKIFWAFWKQDVSARRITEHASYTRLGGNDAADLPPGLPHDYVAVRFYFSLCFPDTAENRRFVSGVVEALAATTDVVLLNTPFTVDDHVDYKVSGNPPRVHTLGRMPPERNLAIQTAVIRRARAFVGTYGGYSYLAPLYGVPSIAFHSARTFFAHHLDLAQRVFADLGTASLVPLDVRDVDLLRSTLQRAGTVPTAAGR